MALFFLFIIICGSVFYGYQWGKSNTLKHDSESADYWYSEAMLWMNRYFDQFSEQ